MIDGKTTNSRSFSLNTYNNAILYVPKGTIDIYKTTKGWKDFVYIEDDATPPTPPVPEKCQKPIISYGNGNLAFRSTTEGATCHYSITDNDIMAGSGNEVQLTATYNISVYATKEGYENSEIVTATLCWIESEPKVEGITTDVVAQVPSKAVLMQSHGGVLTVQGTNDNALVSVYTIEGKLVGESVSRNGYAEVNTALQPGSVVIVKIGQKSVKITMK